VIFEFLTAIKIYVLVFRVITPCGPVDTNVSEKHTVSILSAEHYSLSLSPHFEEVALQKKRE
jgi:hypothetical protein